MKRSVYTIGSLIILLIAAGIFVLVPIFSAGMGHKRLPAFGKYDGTEIRYEQGTDFANYVANIAENFKNSGREINDSNYDYIFEYAFNAAVSKLAAKKRLQKADTRFLPLRSIGQCVHILPMKAATIRRECINKLTRSVLQICARILKIHCLPTAINRIFSVLPKLWEKLRFTGLNLPKAK